MGDDANLYTLLSERFLRTPEAPSFTVADGASISFREFDGQIARLAHALRDLGVRPGDRVTVQIEKSIDNVCLYMATLKVGAVFNSLNTAYTPAEIDYFVGDADPALVVTTPEKLDAIGKIGERHGVRSVETLDGAGGGSLAQRAADQQAAAETVARDRDDLACLVYTSGTTGRSKGAMLSHGNLASNALTLHELWGFVPGDRLLHALPIFHVHGLQVALHTALLNGSEILWLKKFDPAIVTDLLGRASVYMGVPTHYTRLLDYADFGRDACADMRLFISGSAPMLAETHAAFTARTGHRILERYGMSEAGMITSNPYDGERVPGTVGYALPGVSVRIADDKGAVLKPGEVGGVEIKGPNVFKGYWRMPERTAEEFRDDGFFITGDMGVLAEDGRLTLVGREKDLIITGGLNVYPVEIEDQINAIAGIGETAVIGVPHPDFGEGVVAVVTPRGADAVPDGEAVINELRGSLAAFKLPKRVFTVDALPRNAMGKVQKAALREQFKDTFKDG